jgi:hypothetical protein
MTLRVVDIKTEPNTKFIITPWRQHTTNASINICPAVFFKHARRSSLVEMATRVIKMSTTGIKSDTIVKLKVRIVDRLFPTEKSLTVAEAMERLFNDDDDIEKLIAQLDGGPVFIEAGDLQGVMTRLTTMKDIRHVDTIVDAMSRCLALGENFTIT